MTSVHPCRKRLQSGLPTLEHTGMAEMTLSISLQLKTSPLQNASAPYAVAERTIIPPNAALSDEETLFAPAVNAGESKVDLHHKALCPLSETTPPQPNTGTETCNQMDEMAI
uniref:Uncharacterized protein n=1 Tax=Caenorhabditis tropicalis TaxID=1561998 RepID=A0A1I7TT61_9PELO